MTAHSRRTNDGDQRPITALSYNIHRAIGTDGVHSPERITAALAAANCDIIGLQEVDWAAEDELPSTTRLDAFAVQYGYAVVKGPNLMDHRGHYGNMLLTRLPIVSSQQIDLSVAGREPRSAIDATLRTHTGTLQVIVTHFGLGWRERRFQAAAVARQLVQSTKRPGLILGDLNEWVPFSPALRPLLRQCTFASPFATYPARWPLLRLDRIMLANFAGTVSVRVIREGLTRMASDHLPLRVELSPDPDAAQVGLSEKALKTACHEPGTLSAP